MRHGIPAYRLSRRVLDAEIARIVALGVELRCGQAVAGDALDALARTHDAVFVALGAQQPKAPGADRRHAGPGSWTAPATWRPAAAVRRRALGRRVVVVGGGSAAIDVARSARRQGHAVTLLALERQGADAGAARRGRRGAGRGHHAGRRRDAAARSRRRRWRRGADAALPARGLRARRRARALRAARRCDGSDFTLAPTPCWRPSARTRGWTTWAALRASGALLWTDAAGPDQRCAASGPAAT
jgi:cation diffusion facilitator CzcD-associated flavoprotein CzcO